MLEDGMRYEPVSFNAREADWASGVKLSREDCAAAYHVNPAVIWPGDGQTYASAKDNARALYADTLAPLLTMIQTRINKRLAPMVGAPAEEYVEFDLMAKLNGSFEEQVQSMQTAVGGAWMTRQEARARMNLPRVPDGDLITPLNVLVGGLASPTDTAPKSAPRGGARRAPCGAHGGKCECVACKAMGQAKTAPRGRKAYQAPTDDEVGAYRAVLKSFYERQRKSVLSAMGAKSGTRADGSPEWWDADRWDAELAADLLEALESGSARAARDALRQLGLDPDAYDEEQTLNYLKAWAEARASAINAKTLSGLRSALAGEVAEGSQGSTPAGVFALAAGYRAAQQAQTIATQAASFGVCEAARQCAPVGTTKTWIHNPSSAPRAGHERLNGETVGIDEAFSNGARWPGDTKSMTANEVANCHCELELTIMDGEYEFADTYRTPPKSADATEWRSGKHLSRHMRDHAAAFGLDYRTAEGRSGYEALYADTVDNYDHVIYTRFLEGQKPGECAVFIKGESVAVMNIDRHRRVTLFKYAAGVSYFYDRIWDQARG